MQQVSKDKNTGQKKRKTQQAKSRYVEREVTQDEAETRAWATLSKVDGGGIKSSPGRGKKDPHVSSSKAIR